MRLTEFTAAHADIARTLAAVQRCVDQGDRVGALRVASTLLAVCPYDRALHGVIGGLHAAVGNMGDARYHLGRAERTAGNLCLLAMVCLKCSDLPAAIRAAQDALALDPSSKMARHWLEVANTVHGFVQSAQSKNIEPMAALETDLRKEDPMVAFRRLAELGVCNSTPDCPVWRGQPVGHLLVRALEGFGDAVQYVRWCFALRQRVDRLTVATHAKLVRLFERSGLCAVDHATVDDESGFDAQISAVSLPAIMGGPYEPRGGYLTASAATHRECGPMRVGVCWRASKADRSTDLAAVEALSSVGGVEFFNFTHGTPGPAWMRHLDLGDFATTADHMASMDLMLTVDTVTAHLAGAIGRPVWIALPEQADWRWRTGERTPWYESARLFRGRLAQSFTRMADELANQVAPWAVSRELFTLDECARIVEHLQRLPCQAARLASGDSAKFIAQQSFVSPDEPGLEWAHARIARAAAEAGTQLGLRAVRQIENGHFLRYAAGGRFDLHRDDYGEGGRAMSLTLQLSDPGSYAGGDLVINSPDGSRSITADRTLGALTCFRPQCLHAVTPVTAGERRVLVQWIA